MAQTHGWAEATRAVSVIASCVTQPGDYTWVASVFTATVINVLTRLGWGSYWSSMLYARLGRKSSLGTTMLKLHNEMKLTCGYFRHVMILTIVTSRLIVFQETDPARPTFAVFNWTALMAMLLMLFQEFVEDAVVHFARLPEPSVQEVHERWYTSLSIYSLGQLFTTVRKDEDGAEEGPVRILARDAVLGKPCPTLNLHGMRPMPFDKTLGIMGTVMIVAKSLFELLLGVGYLRGICDSSVSNIQSGIMESLLVTTPYGCP